MSAESFFNRLNALLVNNPPEPDDPPLMERIAALGIEPGAAFSMSEFEAELRTAIDEGVAAASAGDPRRGAEAR